MSSTPKATGPCTCMNRHLHTCAHTHVYSCIHAFTNRYVENMGVETTRLVSDPLPLARPYLLKVPKVLKQHPTPGTSVPHTSLLERCVSCSNHSTLLQAGSETDRQRESQKGVITCTVFRGFRERPYLERGSVM